MIDDIRDSRKKFKGLLDQIEVTIANGSFLPVEEGISASVKMIKAMSGQGGQAIFIGNGGSAAIASHMATDFWKNGGIKATAFNDSVLLTCLSNDEGYQHVFEKAIAMFGGPNDVLVAISSSGRSENILRGVAAAKEKGMSVITLSGFKPNNPLCAKGEINFYVPSEHYGYVEVIHHHICHCFIDMIISGKIQSIERVKLHEQN